MLSWLDVKCWGVDCLPVGLPITVAQYATNNVINLLSNKLDKPAPMVYSSNY